MKCRNNVAFPALLLLAGLAASADETVVAEPDEALEPSVHEVTETFLDLDELVLGGTLTDEELNSHRAREMLEVSDITINDQDQDGNVTDNVAIGTTNGDNIINGEAFSDSSGFLSTVQNTGNNVLIQNSTIINVTVETPGN